MNTRIYLINKATIQQYEDLSANVSADRINMCVKKAQDLDLRIFLGDAFFLSLTKQFNDDGTIKDDAPQAYKDLFNGTEYADRAGNTIWCDGIVPALVYFTFARFIETDAVRYTQTGPVTKHHDNSDPVKIGDINKLVQQQRSVANAHLNSVEKFLMIKKSDYPLWRYNEKNKSARQSGPRIRGIDKTSFNAPGITNSGFGYPYDGLIN